MSEPKANSNREANGKLIRVLVVGQTPPPFHGQAVMIQHLVTAEIDGVELIHIRMAFSKSIDDVGRFQIGKLWHLLQVILLIVYRRWASRPDVLYYPPAGPNGVPMWRDIVILISTRWLFQRTIFHMQAGGLSELYPQLRPWQQWLFRRAYFRPDAVIRLSEHTPPDGAALQAQREFIVPNSATDERARFERPLPHDQLRLVYLGTVCMTKGILVLLEACHKLADEGVDFSLQVIGQFQPAKFEQTVRQHVSDLGLELRIELCGQKTGDEKLRQLADADIFCFPTFYESEAFPCVVVEAMSFGLPVVSTRWRGVPSIVAHGETGFLAAPQAVDEFADYLGRLARDPVLRTSMGEAGYQRFLRQFAIESHLRDVEHVIKVVCQPQPKSVAEDPVQPEQPTFVSRTR